MCTSNNVFTFQTSSEKRGRGRPRRYPRPGDPDPNALSAFIIPGMGGQTVVLTPVQVHNVLT